MANSGNYRGDDDDVKLKGGTDDTLIGNVGDRIKVDSLSTPATGALPSWETNVRYEEMNASNGGVARESAIGNTFTNVYNKTGSGYLMGYLVTLESAFDEWEVSLIVDSNTIYTFNTKDLADSNGFGFDSGGSDDPQTLLGFSIHSNTLRWTAPLKSPITYTSSIRVQVRYIKGGSNKFRAGFVVRTV